MGASELGNSKGVQPRDRKKRDSNSFWAEFSGSQYGSPNQRDRHGRRTAKEGRVPRAAVGRKASQRSHRVCSQVFPGMAAWEEGKNENRFENAGGDVWGGRRSVPTHKLNFPTVSPSPEKEAPMEFHGRSVRTGPTAVVKQAWR